MPKIKELREKQGLSQRRLAQALDITENTVANWENGRTGLEWFERVAKLCRALNCTPDELIGYISIPEDDEQ